VAPIRRGRNDAFGWPHYPKVQDCY